MNDFTSKCSTSVDGQKNCIYCSNKCVKNGSAYGKQRYLCKSCKRCFINTYDYNGYDPTINNSIKEHLKEGCGIRSISRLLKISVTTVLRRIKKIAKGITKPIIAMGKEYELDELCTYVREKNNQLWVAYAIRKDTKEVIDFAVGRRTNNTLKQITDTLILSNAVKVYTDKLKQYGTLLPTSIHSTKRNGTNHIERKNLTLRTHLKRLSRRTICFSRSTSILSACLKIYFWA
ncbi:IS1 family transposase [Arachidicoccus sp.]|uniref:IS1 family transposase n=1 Tax=Arachidicoccus sp. TaxID=1872624 RepID=UPI003D201D04